MYFYHYSPDDDEYHLWSDGWDVDEYEILTPAEFTPVKRVLDHYNGLTNVEPEIQRPHQES